MVGEKTYLSLNRILLLAVGLWPYERSNFVRLQLVLFYVILATFIVFQFTTFATSKCTAQFVIEILSVATLYFAFMIKYNAFCFNMDTVNHLVGILQHIYDGLRDDREVAIINKYGNIGRRYTNVLSLIAICCISTIIFLQIMPYIRDIVSLANVSRPRFIQIRTEYFIDQEKYFYLIIFHANAAFIIGCIAIVATGALIIVSFQYACGMFRIARLIDLIVSNFNLSYLLLIVNVITSISLNLYQEVSSGFDSRKLVQSFTCLVICYLYMSIANQLAQQVIDYNNNVYDTVYNVEWYIAPLCIQKAMLFVLQRGAKAFHVTIGGLFIGSLENAAAMMSASMTYFTVLYSIK